MSLNNSLMIMFWDVGSHVSFSETISNSIEHAINKGMNTVQFFLGNPKSFKRQRINKEDIKRSIYITTRFPMYVFSHFIYVANLAGSVKSLAWNGDPLQDRKTSFVLKELEYELSVLSNFGEGMNGVVIHPGCFKNRELGLDTISKSINKINFSKHSRLLLENSAGEGNKLCKNFEEIKRILDGIDETKLEHIGVCVDTAHIWGQGDYDLRKCDEIDRMFDDFDRIIGLEKFFLLHLNDSKVEKGSKKDRHELLGHGCIWEESFESLVYLLNKCKEHRIPSVLETSQEDMYTLLALQEL
jgi:deoxyribonuclease-4